MIGKARQLGRLWRTLRWLKMEQIVGRIRMQLPRRRPDLRAAPPRREAAAGSAWVTPAAREPSLVGPARLRFLEQEHELDDVAWDDPRIALLWRYNQHYFDDLNAARAAERRDWQRALVRRWCEQNPPGRGTAWAPYPTSLRIVNWIKWFLTGADAEEAWLNSLAVQTRWLAGRLEWHLLGNHLFANAKALVFAGLFFDGPEAEAWLTTGLRIVQRELPEQILSDGGQFERSPMYHALALEDLLDLVNIVEARAPAPGAARLLLPSLRRHSARMLRWLRCLRHPGGALARFNDCAEGIAPATDGLERYAAALSVGASPASDDALQALLPSGYVRANFGSAVGLIDVAPVGPDYLPGHAHADTLSFELSVGRRELIVNRGTSVYGAGARRKWERSTAAHSTVQIGGHDSSEVWSGFRVGRRARPGPLDIGTSVLACSHDGYAHLPGHPRHHRRWTFTQGNLLVEDEVQPPPPEPALARFHLAPGLTLRSIDARTWEVRDAAPGCARIVVRQGIAIAVTTQQAERFGVLVDAATLEVQLVDGRAAVHISWGS